MAKSFKNRNGAVTMSFVSDMYLVSFNGTTTPFLHYETANTCYRRIVDSLI